MLEDMGSSDIDQGTLTNTIDNEPINDTSINAQESFKWDSIGLDPNIDKRFNSMWKNPADIFKSFKEIEKASEKNNQSLNQYKKQVEELGTVHSEYNQLKNYIERLDKDPVHGQKLREIIEQFNGNIKQEKYGANIPDELIQKIEGFDKYQQEQEKEKQIQKEIQEWKSSLSEMETWAKKYDVDFNQETQQEFVNFLFEYQEKIGRNVTPIEAKTLFYEISTPQVFEKSKMAGQQATIKNLKNNNLSASLGNNKNTTTIQPKQDTSKMTFTEYFNSK